MKNSVLILLVSFAFSSCTFYEPEFKGGEDLKIGKLEGRTLQLTVGANVYNKNKFAIKVKPSDLNVYVEGDYMGKVHLDEKFKMKGNSETRITAPMTVTLAEGALFKALRFANKEKLQIRLAGDVKAGALLITKKIHIDKTKIIDGINLGL